MELLLKEYETLNIGILEKVWKKTGKRMMNILGYL
jgi:hypothetical protein